MGVDVFTLKGIHELPRVNISLFQNVINFEKSVWKINLFQNKPEFILSNYILSLFRKFKLLAEIFFKETAVKIQRLPNQSFSTEP